MIDSNLRVIKITYEDTKPFILLIHYAKRMPCIQYSYGLFENNRLIGVVTYGQPASPFLCNGVAGLKNKKRVLELNRLVIIPGYEGKNYASILISKSLKMLPKDLFIVSYADTGMGHVGYVYQATNWLYTGLTKERTDKMSSAGHARHYEKGETKRQIRTAKHRYIYFTGNKKKQLKELLYQIIDEYPKGNNERYEVNCDVEIRKLI